MCGFVGYLSPDGFNEAEAQRIIIEMRDRMIPRGPDDAGIWLDASAGIALGHRRLSVLDTSAAGRQPMCSPSGRFIVAFNGEIYNHLELRRRLEQDGQVGWNGNSDTETLLAAIERWGIVEALKASIGMFAFALWSRQERTLILARDRIGEKPLYYGWQNGTLLFGSTLKALLAHPSCRAEIDRDVLQLYLRLGYVPTPYCIYKNFQKLTPGTYVEFTNSSACENPVPRSYWSFENAVLSGLAAPFRGTAEDAIDTVEQQLLRTIEIQRLADVPLGAFLSGGIDSTTLVALLQKQTSRPIKTFTVGFNEQDYSEASAAKRIANYLGTDHCEMFVAANQAQEVIPKMPLIYDEPFGDSSAIPTFLLAGLARKSVTVSLSGDGGDELFGGYNRYFSAKTNILWMGIERAPKPMRSGLQTILNAIPPLNNNLAQKVILAAELLKSRDHTAYYQKLMSHWTTPPVLYTPATRTMGYAESQLEKVPQNVLRMMAHDTVTYLPDDILVKVDRAAMDVSLETRVPYLDHRLVELVWSMPYDFRIRGRNGKWLLRQILHRHVPQHLVDRPKMGFAIPLDKWLRGPLRQWANDLLSTDSLQSQGYLDTKAISSRWQAHLAGRQDSRDSIWIILMWQAWLAKSNSHA
jgi:asparagine synthase (glutamine-hydrolysing)